MMPPNVRRLFLLSQAAPLMFLSACASPCERIEGELRQLNADAIHDPSMAADGRYLDRFRELGAQAVEKNCLPGD